MEDRSLCCPVSLELFDDPVQTPCCGNSLNRASLRQSLPRCPLCRVDIGTTHPTFGIDDVPTNRAVASLVDEHRAKATPREEAIANHSGAKAAALEDAIIINSSDDVAPTGSKKCAQCNRPGARLRCSRCKCVCYCSASCQRAAWAVHKRTCLAAPAVSAAVSAAAMAAVEAAEAAGLDREHIKVLAQHARQAPMATSTTVLGSAVLGSAVLGSAVLGDAVLSGVVLGAAGPALKLVDAICAGVRDGTIRAFSDEPNYSRLVLVSCDKSGGVTYHQHGVEAMLIITRKGPNGRPEVLSELLEMEERADSYRCPSVLDASDSDLIDRARAGWLMGDHIKLFDLKDAGLLRMDAPTVTRQFGRALAVFDACKARGPPHYAIKVDAAVPDDQGDNLVLVEQMLGETALRCVLGMDALERLERKHQCPSQDEVRQALGVFQTMRRTHA